MNGTEATITQEELIEFEENIKAAEEAQELYDLAIEIIDKLKGRLK